VAIILGEEELEVCLWVLDVSDLIFVIDVVARDLSAGSKVNNQKGELLTPSL
jgi:hypothetical protein